MRDGSQCGGRVSSRRHVKYANWPHTAFTNMRCSSRMRWNIVCSLHRQCVGLFNWFLVHEVRTYMKLHNSMFRRQRYLDPPVQQGIDSTPPFECDRSSCYTLLCPCTPSISSCYHNERLRHGLMVGRKSRLVVEVGKVTWLMCGEHSRDNKWLRLARDRSLQYCSTRLPQVDHKISTLCHKKLINHQSILTSVRVAICY